MRIKELIHEIKSNPLYMVLQRATEMPIDEYRNSYISKYTVDENYLPHVRTHRKRVYDRIIRHCEKHLPKYESVVKFWHNESHFEVSIFIGVDPYYDKSKIISRIYVRCDDFERYLWYNNKWEVPLNLNLDNPAPQLKNIINRKLFTEGKAYYIQSKFQCEKHEVKNYWSMFDFMNYNELSNAKVDKWIEKNFNVKPNGYTYEAISFVNKHGKQDKAKSLCRFEYSGFETEGDIDEVENMFWEEMKQYPDGAIFIN
jgi:hypothetical protein